MGALEEYLYMQPEAGRSDHINHVCNLSDRLDDINSINSYIILYRTFE